MLTAKPGRHKPATPTVRPDPAVKDGPSARGLRFGERHIRLRGQRSVEGGRARALLPRMGSIQTGVSTGKTTLPRVERSCGACCLVVAVLSGPVRSAQTPQSGSAPTCPGSRHARSTSSRLLRAPVSLTASFRSLPARTMLVRLCTSRVYPGKVLEAEQREGCSAIAGPRLRSGRPRRLQQDAGAAAPDAAMPRGPGPSPGQAHWKAPGGGPHRAGWQPTAARECERAGVSARGRPAGRPGRPSRRPPPARGSRPAAPPRPGPGRPPSRPRPARARRARAVA